MVGILKFGKFCSSLRGSRDRAQKPRATQLLAVQARPEAAEQSSGRAMRPCGWASALSLLFAAGGLLHRTTAASIAVATPCKSSSMCLRPGRFLPKLFSKKIYYQILQNQIQSIRTLSRFGKFRLIFGCIGTDFCNRIRVLHYVRSEILKFGNI